MLARMAVSSATPDSATDLRRVILSSYLGSTIEFYDFLLYGSAAALVFPTVFFSGLDPLTSLLFSFGTFAAGYLARPVGAVLFGHFGDRVGRKKMLVVTMFVMGIASFLIGLLPGSAAIGGWAGVLLVTLRIVQGVALGGEWGGAALMALEHSGGGRRGLAASFVNAGAPSGTVLGSLLLGLSALMPPEQFFSWGWRIPFLFSAVLLAVGLWVRSRVAESPVFVRAMADGEARRRSRPRLPLWSVLRRPRVLLLTTLSATAAFAFQTGMATFGQAYAVQSGTARPAVLLANSGAAFVGIFGVVTAGRLSDRYGRRPLIFTATVLWVLLAYPILSLLGSGDVRLVFLGFLIGVVLFSQIYGPLAAFMTEQFATGARYTGSSLGYQLATLIGGAFTPAILTSLYAGSGRSITPVALYLGAAGAVSAVTVLIIREGNRVDLATVRH